MRPRKVSIGQDNQITLPLPEKEWTIMVYLAGDNNLSEEMITALTGLKDAIRTAGEQVDEKVNIVAVYDSGYPTVPIKHFLFMHANCDGILKDCEIEYIHPQYRRRNKPLSETNYIIDFVRWSAENFPAQNYVLILSGHSDGIVGRTMFQDSNPKKALNLKKVGNILEKARRHLQNNKKFSLIGFDSCLMSMAEVGYELSGIAEIVVSSEGNVPTSGWSYFEIISSLISYIQAAKPKTEETKVVLAKRIVDKFIDYSASYNIGGRSVNISACDLREAGKLRNSVNALAKAFNEIFDSPIKAGDYPTDQLCTNAFIIERFKMLIHNSHYYSQTFMYEQAVDLVDFVNTLSSNCDLALQEVELMCGMDPQNNAATTLKSMIKKIKAKCKSVADQVNLYVLANGYSGSDYQFSSGVSVFFPWSLLSLFMVYGGYRELKFSRYGKADWFRFIEKFAQLTYRATDEPLYGGGDYLKWRNEVAAKHAGFSGQSLAGKDVSGKDVSGKDVSGKDVSGKDVSGKDVSGKDVFGKDVSGKDVSGKDVSGKDGDAFYAFFRRFRNHPIFHDVVHKTLK